MSNTYTNESNSQQDKDQQSPSSSTSSLRAPVLEVPSMVATIRETILVNEVDILVRRLLTRPNHQSPYAYAFYWEAPEDSNLNYSVRLIINEPA